MKKKGFLICVFLLVLAASMPVYAAHGRCHGGYNQIQNSYSRGVSTHHYYNDNGCRTYCEYSYLSDNNYGGFCVNYNGSLIEFEQNPVILNGCAMVSVRNVVEEMGCTVVWDEDTQTVYINSAGVALNKTAKYTGEINVFVNNEQVDFEDQKPAIINGRTMIPIKCVAEKLGCTTHWDEDLQMFCIKGK